MLPPDRVGFISYPYEWSFGQLQDAAMLTLEIQQRALARGLRCATAAPTTCSSGAASTVIDTLSFEPLEEASPGGV